ncbi:telomere length regulation protein, putative [Candida dubliniensis CD36]|uniref:Telomere length regulation protein, putative n=1 Tax=Candida dubliniensis (strain CD36 / ATCC MYA-646 / CBS 7987 / NCPF 3949 / NRRL Y-17841) TaxID=573826 RepID=B9WN43_CANDC|nr:telomere length regulation protein, putative [Candida dubliniensis CD36]CAX40510.1 telomere length regulation protein, putative [Candida dubliniensis CD36]
MEIAGSEDTLQSQDLESSNGQEEFESHLNSTTRGSLLNVLRGNQTTKKNSNTSKIRKEKHEPVVNEDTTKQEYHPTPLTSKDIFKIFRQKDKQKSTLSEIQQTPAQEQHSKTSQGLPNDMICNSLEILDFTADIESKIFANKKSTSVKDLFNNFRPKKIVSIKLSPQILKSISSSCSNIEHSRGLDVLPGLRTTFAAQEMLQRGKPTVPIHNTEKIDNKNNDIQLHTSLMERKIYESRPKSSVQDILKRRRNDDKTTRTQPIARPTYFITLKMNSKHLAEIKQYENPLITKGNKTSTNGKTSASLFASMMQASKSATKLESMWQSKNSIILPNSIKKEEFHIYEKEVSNPRKLSLEERNRNFRCDIYPGNFESFADLFTRNTTSIYHHEIKDKIDLKQYALSKLPNLLKASALEFVFNMIAQPKQGMWTETFKPQKMNQLLMHKRNKNDIYNWISNSFLKLKSQAPIKDMKQKIKQRRQESFIVYDYEDEETEEEVYSPFLILQGSCGSGKSTAVFTAMNELDGFVHEINTSQNRGRKDIFASLKELCTTEAVRDTKEFHRGVVLLEDVNVLFEQDKTFWSVVQEVINVSKRPIILTCEEIWNIPKNLIEFAQHDESMIFIDDYVISKNLVIDYLWLCCLVYNCDVSRDILDEVVDENWDGHNFDVRGCLMSCQIMCPNRPDGLTVITRIPEATEKRVLSNINEASHILDINSCSDVIGENSISQLTHTLQVNEFDDIYWIDDCHNHTLPYELNIGNKLSDKLEEFELDFSVPQQKFIMNDLRYEANKFIGSRMKYCSNGDFRRSTRSGGSSGGESNAYLDTTGIPDTSFLNHIANNSFILDLLPMARLWSQYQKDIDQFEKDALDEGKPSIKRFLKYRDFRHKTTLDATISRNT